MGPRSPSTWPGVPSPPCSNDGYLPVVGARHPGLGLPFATLWAEIWDQLRPIVAATTAGEAQHFVDLPIAVEGRPGRPVGWFTFSYTPLRDDESAIAGFCCAATETTERVLAERRQTVLLALSDAERRLLDPVDVMGTACEALAHELHAVRVGYAEVDDDGEGFVVRREHRRADLPGADGPGRIGDYGGTLARDLREGHAVAVADVGSDPRTAEGAAAHAACGTRALLAVPIRRDGRLRATLHVNADAPRVWSEADVDLVEAVAERTWTAVERARGETALRESEARLTRAVAMARLGTFEWNLGTGAVTLDVRSRDLWGFETREAVIAADVFARIHPDRTTFRACGRRPTPRDRVPRVPARWHDARWRASATLRRARTAGPSAWWACSPT